MHIRPGHSFAQRLRKALLSGVWLTTLAMTLPACSQQADPVSGSETHFLEACNMSCPADLECVDGQCSQFCNTDAPCNDLNGAASCEMQPSGVKACEVGCSGDADCTKLRTELSCSDGVCRGPLWQLNVNPDGDEPDADDTAESDATVPSESNSPDATPGSSSPDAGCGEHPGCPPDEAIYFLLPEEGLGTVRLEFMFNLGDVPYTRCSVDFVADELTESSCESDSVAPATFEQSCPTVSCSFGSLRFDLRPVDFEVTYWQDVGYQYLPTNNETWSEETYQVGPLECDYQCTTTQLVQTLPSTKGLGACLTQGNECNFGLGCGDRESALANAPACDEANTNVLAGAGCGYDVLRFEQYIEGALAFYDQETGEFVGYWHRSDTFSVSCSGQVPFDCIEGVEFTNVCELPDAG